MSKLIRVEMEYDDGRIQQIVGDIADQWLQAVNGILSLGWVHGVKMPNILWEVVKEADVKSD